MKKNKCKICGCTDDNACLGGCYWIDDKKTLCSKCFFTKKQKIEKE